MKAVMISIKPKWCAKIASGEKTIEVRKTKPKLETPFKCYIYETKDKVKITTNYKGLFDARTVRSYNVGGCVIGEFVCDKIDGKTYRDTYREVNPLRVNSCLSWEEISEYADDAETLYFWNISNLKIYDKPKELNEFSTITRPPQSWCYTEQI